MWKGSRSKESDKLVIVAMVVVASTVFCAGGQVIALYMLERSQWLDLGSWLAPREVR